MQAAEQVSVERRWVRIQAASGLAFGTFLALHLANSIAAAFGPEVYDGLQARLRLYYQNPLVEIALVGSAALVHAASGLVRMRRRRAREAHGAQTRPEPRWLIWHRRTGYFLLLVIVGHFFATRGPSLFLDVPVDLSYLHFSLETWPFVMFPYYFALFSAGTYHGLHGALAALEVFGLALGRARSRVLFIIALVAGTAGILGMAGVTQDVSSERFQEYRELYETYLPFMRTW